MIGSIDRWPKIALACALALFAASCANDAPAPPTKKVVSRDWLREIRTEALKYESAVEVSPLQDPQVADLKTKADAAEQRGKPKTAEKYLRRALAHRPEDPELWQRLAETQLARRLFAEAEPTAQKSFSLGPKVGSLCVRNWLTIHASRAETGRQAEAAQAKVEAGRCQVQAVIRM